MKGGLFNHDFSKASDGLFNTEVKSPPDVALYKGMTPGSRDNKRSIALKVETGTYVTIERLLEGFERDVRIDPRSFSPGGVVWNHHQKTFMNAGGGGHGVPHLY